MESSGALVPDSSGSVTPRKPGKVSRRGSSGVAPYVPAKQLPDGLVHQATPIRFGGGSGPGRQECWNKLPSTVQTRLHEQAARSSAGGPTCTLVSATAGPRPYC